MLWRNVLADPRRARSRHWPDGPRCRAAQCTATAADHLCRAGSNSGGASPRRITVADFEILAATIPAGQTVSAPVGIGFPPAAPITIATPAANTQIWVLCPSHFGRDADRAVSENAGPRPVCALRRIPDRGKSRISGDSRKSHGSPFVSQTIIRCSIMSHYLCEFHPQAHH